MSELKPSETTRIEHGSKVWLHFSVALENGPEIDSTFNQEEPVSLTVGDGNLLEGFEKVLMGLTAGDKRTAVLEPTEAFGEHNPDNLQRFSRTQFALAEEAPEVGMMIEFEDKAKTTLPGVVKEVTDTEVVVDFNHPLAGRSIVFQIEVFKVLPPGGSVLSFS